MFARAARKCALSAEHTYNAPPNKTKFAVSNGKIKGPRETFPIKYTNLDQSLICKCSECMNYVDLRGEGWTQDRLTDFARSKKVPDTIKFTCNRCSYLNQAFSEILKSISETRSEVRSELSEIRQQCHELSKKVLSGPVTYDKFAMMEQRVNELDKKTFDFGIKYWLTIQSSGQPN